MWSRSTVSTQLFAACIACMPIAAQADETTSTAVFHEQIETQLRAKVEEGWLNPACVILVVNNGAFFVSEKGELQACSAGKCDQLVRAGVLKKGRAVSPDKVTSNYTITEKARPFLAPHQQEPRAEKLCFAKATLDNVISASAIAPLGLAFDHVIAQFTVRLHDKAPWAETEQFQKAFPVAQSKNLQQISQAMFTRDGDKLRFQAN